MSGFIYLASPFWHDREMVRIQRYSSAKRETARLLQKGYCIYSPIVHSFYLHGMLPEVLQHNHEFWLSLDEPFVRQAVALWILTLDGWRDSKGIAIEKRIAEEAGVPIYLIGEHQDAPAEVGRNPYFREPATKGV